MMRNPRHPRIPILPTLLAATAALACAAAATAADPPAAFVCRAWMRASHRNSRIGGMAVSPVPMKAVA